MASDAYDEDGRDRYQDRERKAPSYSDAYEEDDQDQDQYRERKAKSGYDPESRERKGSGHSESYDEDDYGGRKASSKSEAGKKKAPSTSELMASAKVLAGAAKGDFDKAKVCEAANNVLEAASHYGNLDEKGYAGYIDQAEGFLQKYGGRSGSGGGAAHSAGHDNFGSGGGAAHSAGHDSFGSGGGAAHSAGHDSFGSGGNAAHSAGHGHEKKKHESADGAKKKEDDDEGGGFGDYLKIAQGFMKG